MSAFEPERAFAEWRRALRRNPALEDGEAAELECGLRDEYEELVAGGMDPESAFRQALEATGPAADSGPEFYRAKRTRRSARPPWQAPRPVPPLVWSYIRIALRKLRREKGYAFINIAGLAVGLACSILMMLWVRQETSFDRFHADRDSIYRLVTETKNQSAVTLDARAPTPTGPAVKAEVPEVLEFCRYRTNKNYGLRLGDKALFEAVIGIADPSFFTMFTFPFLKGDPKTALDDPRSIVITESVARTFFGNEDPMGRLLTITRDPYAVTGVIRDVPENSHLHFACVIPAVNMHEYHHVDFENWNSMFFNCYVRLAPGASPAEAAAKMSGLVAGRLNKPNVGIRPQPLKDVHLKSDFAFDLDNYAQGSASTLTLFSLAAAAILLLACINFMNLATARSAKRAKEVGLRKVTGARRSDIVRQFLGESVLLTFLGLGLALLLLWAVLPLFNTFAGKPLDLRALFEPGLAIATIGVMLLTGLLAGSYPAFYLAAFEPARVLKGTFFAGQRGQAALRKGLVIVQFAVTVFFIAGVLIVDKQLRFVRTKDLGIDTHQVITTVVRSERHREAVLADPRILAASLSAPPGMATRAAVDVSWEGKDPEDRTPFFPVPVDPAYLETFRAGMAEGRFFSRERESDRTEAVVVNQTAARAMGPGSPLGKRLTLTAMSMEGTTEARTMTVIGVMKDIHQSSLRRAIEPTVFTWDLGPWLNLRIDPNGVPETITFLEKTWKSFVTEFPFTYEFLDDKYDAFYKQDRRTRSILGVFAALALFSACLGLVGLASFIAERKTKEIGIRKVLGASPHGLVLWQSRGFLGWVLAANLAALPAAYFAAGRWLRSFAYRVDPSIGPALLAAAFSLAVAFFSVAYRAVQAARSNPVDSLRFE
jgi:ABC-type antimicrobial peptide transport system permease subunit